MRIEKLKVDGFGHFRQFELALKPGLNVLYGPNEAGKSTLLAFIRAVLFGFERRTEPERYEDESGPYGGELLLDTGRGPLTVRRLGGGRRRVEGELTVKDGTGELVSDGRLREALYQVNKTLFREVFAFSLQELSSLGSLVEQKDVSEALFAAGMQGAHRLPEALSRLRDGTARLFKPGGKTAELNAQLAELAATRERLEGLGNRPAEYFAARARLEAIDGEEAALRRELEEALQQRDRLGRLLAVSDDLLAWTSARRGLEGLPDFQKFPDGAVARLEALTAALDRAKSHRAGRQEAFLRCERALKLASDEKLGEDRERRLRAAAEAFNARAAQYQALPGRRESTSARRRQIEADLRNLGLKLTASQLLEADLSTAARGTISALKDRVADAERVLSQLDERHRSARTRTGQVEELVRRLTSEAERLPRSQPPALRRAQVALSRMGSLVEQAQLAERTRAEKAAQLAALQAQTEPKPLNPVPAWSVPVAGAVLTALCVVAALVAGTKVLALGLVGSICMVGLLLLVQRRMAGAHAQALVAHAARERFRTEELARLTAEQTALDARVADLRAQAAEAAREAGIAADASQSARDARLEALSEELRGVERRIELSRELEGLSAQLASVRKEETEAYTDRNVAEAARSRILRELSQRCAPLGFPADLSPDQALYLFAEASGLKGRLFDLQAEEQGLAAEGRACDEVVAALRSSADEFGLPTETPEGAAAAVIDLADRAREGRRDRQRLLLEQQELALQLQKAEEAEAEARSGIEGLLLLAEAKDGEELRARDAQARRWRELEKEARERALKIESAAGLDPAEADAALRQAGGPDSARRAAAELDEAGGKRSAALKALEQERGLKRAALAAFENDDSVGRLRAEEELQTARLEELVQRYAVERVALALLERARARFEKEAQPRLVQIASRLFEGLTGGRYVRAFLPAERPGELWVTSGDGRDRGAAQLSRGTREQLYLAFRLAVIEEFAQTRGPLPVIVDDILVNFDEQRTRNTLSVFARLAKDHQFIAFTCHKALRDAFAEHGAHVVEVIRPKTHLFDAKAG